MGVNWAEDMFERAALAAPESIGPALVHHINRRPHGCTKRAMAWAVFTVAAQEAATVAYAVAAGRSVETGLRCSQAAGALLRMTAGKPPPPVRVPRFSGPLWADPELADLPLLDLAGDWASLTGNRLVVLRSQGREYTRGRTMRERDVVLFDEHGGQTVTAAVVEIGDDDVATWAHELAHLLAPDRWRSSELYADRLGAQLLGHHPQTLHDAQRWIEFEVDQVEFILAGAAGQASPPSPVDAEDEDDLPEDPFAAMVAFGQLLPDP